VGYADEEGSGFGGRRRKPRAPGDEPKRPLVAPTKAFLSRAALAYVERYPSTIAGLTRVLKRKLERYEHKSGEALPDEARGWIDPIVAELVERGFVDDQRLATAKTASLQRKGKSKRAVSAALRAKGVQSETIDEVLAASETTDEQAAWRLARKKKLGPYRAVEDRKALRQKDLAVLGRAGFSFQTARAIIESDEPRDVGER
jgi:regulatory protein